MNWLRCALFGHPAGQALDGVWVTRYRVSTWLPLRHGYMPYRCVRCGGYWK